MYRGNPLPIPSGAIYHKVKCSRGSITECCACICACRYKENKWDPKQLIGSGGMPSSHSATVTALAVGVGLQEGFGGPQFATALVLACVVCSLSFSINTYDCSRSISPFPIGSLFYYSFSWLCQFCWN